MTPTRASTNPSRTESLHNMRSHLARWAPLPLRLIVGFGFMQHGFAKLGRGPDHFAAILQALGTPAPHLMAWISILTEILGGLAVLLGALVPLAAIPMAILLIVAIFTVHLRFGSALSNS
jgi:putative oxidoreductase